MIIFTPSHFSPSPPRSTPSLYAPKSMSSHLCCPYVLMNVELPTGPWSTLKEIDSLSPRSYHLSIVPQSGVWAHEPLLIACLDVDCFDTVWVLCWQPQLPWVHEYSSPVMYRRSLQSSWTSGSYSISTPSEMIPEP